MTIRPVDGGSGPFNPTTADAEEASLDTQMSLGTAPGAQETLYNIPDLTFAAIADAYAAIDDDNSVDVVSSSFGGCERDFLPAYNGGQDCTNIPRMLHQLFLQGNAQGITFLASSGDSGAVPCLSAAFVENPTNGTSFIEGVETPASDPNVTGVGGTNLVTVPTPTVNDVTYSQENAQFDPLLPAAFHVGPSEIVTVNNNTWGSGGGYSILFGKPLYQLFSNTTRPGRAVPDVSLMMGGCPGGADIDAGACSEPTSADIIWVGGGLAFLDRHQFLLARDGRRPRARRRAQRPPRQRQPAHLQHVLPANSDRAAYASRLQVFHRNIKGNNNGFKVKPGDAFSTVLGNGTLNVKNFLGLQNRRLPPEFPALATNP